MSLTERLAASTSRRGFLARAGRALTLAAGGAVLGSTVKPGDADAFHFCGHTWTTGSCPHPTGIPRADIRGFPLRARDGVAVDDLGRRIDKQGRPVDERGRVLRDPGGNALPPASRSRVCAAVEDRYGMPTRVDGSWYRCCGGHVRKLQDCCSYSPRRINGDGALTGYCYSGRKVFCVFYYQTKVPC